MHRGQRSARTNTATTLAATPTSWPMPTFPDDRLPPEAAYESRDALFKSINL